MRLPRPSAFRRWSVRVVTAFGLARGLGCPGPGRPPAAGEDSVAAAPDSVGRLAGDTVAPVLDSVEIAALSSRTVHTHAPTLIGLGTGADSTRPSGTAALSPLADSIAQYLVFDPIVQTWFMAAKRGKRLLLDIGRVDINVQRDKRKAAAFLQAVRALSPIPIGTPVRVHGPWGIEDDTIAGFTTWNDRIAATLHLSRKLDSLVRHSSAVYAAVDRVDTAPPDTLARDSSHIGDTVHLATAPTPMPPQGTDSLAVRDTCVRDSLSPALALRAAAVRDSIDFWLRSLPPPPYERLVNTERSQSSQVSGCFGGGNRLAVVVDLRAGANEWIRERAVLIDTLGRVTSLRMNDYRFKGHSFLAAVDPNDSGVDGIVARGFAQSAGGLVILALTPPNRLTRWVGGFAWEAR